MRVSGWVITLSEIRKFFFGMRILNVTLGEGHQEGHEILLLSWKRAANHLAESSVMRTHTFHGKAYEKCCPGCDLLTHMIETKYAANRDIAIKICKTLIDHELLHHITYEFGSSDIDSAELFTLVETRRSMFSDDKTFDPKLDIGAAFDAAQSVSALEVSTEPKIHISLLILSYYLKNIRLVECTFM